MNIKVRFVTNITKEYSDMFKILVYKEPKVFVRSESVKRKREQVDGEVYQPTVSSLNRTKTLVRDIVLCNDFELFATFTFDPKKVDSFELGKCWLKMSSWLHHQKENSREKGIEFKYLIIPEQHKSGRWHFHALISGYTSTLKDTKLVTTALHPIFNITSFRSGFTTAVKVDSKEGVSNYITKYITKDFVKSFNQRRFFCSRNLTRPIRTVNSGVVSTVLPLFKKKVAENSETIEYIIDKNSSVVYNPNKNVNVAQYRNHDFDIL